MRQCRKTNREVDWSNYKRQPNKVNNLVKSTKGNYNKKLLLESVNRPEKFWKSIKRVFPSKQQNGTSTSFNINGAEISNKKSIADNFCLFFTNVGETLKSKSIPFERFYLVLSRNVSTQDGRRF